MLPLELVGYACISQEKQRQLIRAHLAQRREQGSLSALPDRPKVLIAACGSTTSKIGWAAGWDELGCDAWMFDWVKESDQYAEDWEWKGKHEFQDRLRFAVAHQKQEHGLDILVCYLSGRWVFPETICSIREQGILTVNVGFDDTLKFWGYTTATGYTGNAEVCRAFDICITSQNKINVGKYVLAGANPLYLPPGGDNNPALLHRGGNGRVAEVSFIGSNYGQRTELVGALRGAGIPTNVRGYGWPEGVATLEQMGQILGSSLVTLGVGYIGESEITGLKGRDFYVPMTGAAYLTTYCSDLTEFFEEGREMMFYQSAEELIEKARWMLDHPKETRAMAERAKERALREYRWANCWAEVLRLCRV